MYERVRMPILFCSFLALFLASGAYAEESIRPIPVVPYVMASPRACLIGPTFWDDIAGRFPFGDADNFQRHAGSVRIPVGGKIHFSLSRNIEGVWYTGSYGLLGTVLEIQWCPLCKDGAPSATDIESVPANSKDTAPGDRCWITVGKDGARNVRRGPSIGTARVGVPVRFLRPGIYHMRGIVTTFADSYIPHTSDVPPQPDAMDEDVIYVTVYVLPHLEPGEEAGAMDTLDPDEAENGDMPNGLDGEPVTVEAEIDGEEVVTWTNEG